MRADVRVGAIVVGLLLLAGCGGGLPTSGPVEEGVPIAARSEPPYVGNFPVKPEDGADEVSIVEGFLASMRSYVPGYPGATEYLTPEASTSWDPSAQIQVFEGTAAAARKVADGLVQLSMQVAGHVSADGTYTPATEGESAEIPIPLTQVDGEWRIAGPPPGLVLSESQFEREYAPYEVYFPEPVSGVLVADQVMLPVGGANQSTLLVQSLLRGPTQWLASAVATAFPEGTALVTDSVPVQDGVATVNLTGEVRAASQDARSRLAAQLFVTLSSQLAGIDEVAITVEGAPLSVPGTSPDNGVVSASTVRTFDPSSPSRGNTIYAVLEGRVVTVLPEGEETAPVGGAFGAADAGVRSVGISPDSGLAAAVDASGTRLLRARFDSGPQEELATGTDFSAPSWGREGDVWTVDRTTEGSRLLRVDGDAVTHVDAPELLPWHVDTVRINADGVRVLFVAEQGRRRVALVGLLRQEQPDAQVPLSLVGLHEVPFAEGAVLDADWVDVSQIALLAGSAGESVRTPYIVAISGLQPTARQEVTGADELAASPAARDLLVVSTADGQLQQQDSRGRWLGVGEGFAPAFPG